MVRLQAAGHSKDPTRVSKTATGLLCDVGGCVPAFRFFLSLNSYFYHEEVMGRQIDMIVVVAFSYSLCGGSSVIFS